MKKFFTKTASAMLTLGLFTVNADAKDLYLSSTGNDGNTGLTADSPRKTLTSLDKIIEMGDIVHIKGLLNMDDEYQLAAASSLSKGRCGHFYKEGDQNGFNLKIDKEGWMNITFVGEDPEDDGFTGDDKWRFFELGRETGLDKCLQADGTEGFNTENAWVSFKNLRFQNGLAPKEGGTFYVHDHIDARFDNCVFENNHFDFAGLEARNEDGMDIYYATDNTGERGGVFHFQFGKLTISKSVFRGNNGRMGGAICQTGGTLNLTDTYFEENGKNYNGKPIKNTRGGALCLWTLHQASIVNIDRCAFVSNTAYNDGGAIFFRNNVDDNTDRRVDANITNCYFAFNNTVWEHGGAISANNNDGKDINNGSRQFYIKIANSTFFSNTAGFYGGAICYNGGVDGSKLWITNSTFTANGGNGNRNTNRGHGACLTMVKDGNKSFLSPENVDVRIANTIMEGNLADNGETNDLSLSLGAMNPKNVKVYNSLIGQVLINDQYSMDDFKAANATSLILYNNENDNAKLDASLDAAYVQSDHLYFNGMNWGVAPLDEYATDVPDADEQFFVQAPVDMSYDDKTWTVNGYDISKHDMCGNERTDDNKHMIGATVKNTSHYVDIMDNNFGEMEFYPTTGINDILAESGRPAIVREGDIISAAGSGKAQITVYDLRGLTLVKGAGSVSIASLVKGAYIVTVVDGASHNVVKIIK